jgi:tRNA(Arg) A34 adenosine deaminase TadA
MHRDNYVYVERKDDKMVGGKSHDLEITVLEHAEVMEWRIACRSRSWWHCDQSR